MHTLQYISPNDGVFYFKENSEEKCYLSYIKFISNKESFTDKIKQIHFDYTEKHRELSNRNLRRDFIVRTTMKKLKERNVRINFLK